MVGVSLGNGDGTFRTPVTYTIDAAATALTIGDFNGDGIPDLAVADGLANDVSILLGTGNGAFALEPISFGVGGVPVSIASGDLNGDGKLDLVAGQGSGVDVLINMPK